MLICLWHMPALHTGNPSEPRNKAPMHCCLLNYYQCFMHRCLEDPQVESGHSGSQIVSYAYVEVMLA